MAFQYAYSLDGDGTNVVKDYPMDTVANFPLAKQTKGTLVKLVSGLLQPVGAAGGSGIGVFEGGEFIGLVASGQPYAATTANAGVLPNAINTTKNPNGVGKVRNDKTAAVFKVPVRQAGVTQTAANANIGVQYAIILNGNDQQVDLNTTTTPSVTILDYTPDGKNVFVTLV